MNNTTTIYPEDLADVLSLSADDLARYKALKVLEGLPEGRPSLPSIKDAVPCWIKPVLKEGAEPKGTDLSGFAALLPYSVYGCPLAVFTYDGGCYCAECAEKEHKEHPAYEYNKLTDDVDPAVPEPLHCRWSPSGRAPVIPCDRCFGNEK